MVTLVKSGFSSSGGLPPAPRTGKAVSSPSRSTVNGEKEHLVSDSRHFQERAVNNSGENGRTAAEGGDESSNDIDLDLGEGTSASGPKLMVKMSRGVGQTHFDVATLLKDPIVFVAPRFYDDSNENIPYEPLPMGPQCQVSDLDKPSQKKHACLGSTLVLSDNNVHSLPGLEPSRHPGDRMAVSRMGNTHHPPTRRPLSTIAVVFSPRGRARLRTQVPATLQE